ncbi:hypothetical protein [Bradyrhizobium japonicum]|uniref:hypothetical protein n=1 Tax=Bradyrhizobium japonicum TaxID=375 RepID=UPI0012BD3A13|nr:hypothetical protein [Bradyrhizobium japonicum]
MVQLYKRLLLWGEQQMSSEQSGPDIRDFEIAAAGYTILVTWPEVRDGKHAQEVWYVHLGDQLEAVKAVQAACGALNDAKVELLGSLSESRLLAHGVPDGNAKRAADSSITSSP